MIMAVRNGRKVRKERFLSRLRDSEENEHMIRQEDDWLYEQEINEGDQVVFTENRLYKRI